jgi:hypothetical protein
MLVCVHKFQLAGESGSACTRGGVVIKPPNKIDKNASTRERNQYNEYDNGKIIGEQIEVECKKSSS